MLRYDVALFFPRRVREGVRHEGLNEWGNAIKRVAQRPLQRELEMDVHNGVREFRDDLIEAEVKRGKNDLRDRKAPRRNSGVRRK